MNAPAPAATRMSGDDFRESLRRCKLRVLLDGRQMTSMTDERGFGTGVNVIVRPCGYALKAQLSPRGMRAASDQNNGNQPSHAVV